MNKQAKIFIFSILIISAILVLSLANVIAPPPTKQCRDGVDNDGDGFTDWPNDPGCSSKNDDNELGTTTCDNGIDDDGDGNADMADNGCSSPTDSSERGTDVCDDGSDNDGDGQADYPSDPGCTGPTDTSEYGTAQCDDGSDNDGDGDTDMNDNGCSSLTDNDETNCGDGAISGSEVCDGTNLNNQTCSSQGYDAGTLSCNSECTGFVTTQCYTNTCTDTDGFDIFVAGSTSGNNMGSSYTYNDFCNGTIVWENYCSGSTPQVFSTDCSTTNITTTCSSGACV